MNKIEKVIVSFAFIIFVGSVGAILGYESFFNKSVDKQIIATVESVTNHSLVKSPDGHEYKELKANDPISNGDNLLSGKDSKIQVKFINGPRIMVGEESTLSLRQIDGQPDLKIDKGSFSGTFEEGDVLDVLTQNEVITLNGESDTQFSIAHAETGEVEIGSFDKDLEVEYKGEKFNLKNEKASVSKKEGLKQNQKTSAKNSDSLNNKLQNPNSGPGISIDDISESKKSVALSAPFPKENHIFLHNKGGKILVFPKAQCKGPCEIEISLNEDKKIKKVFSRDMAPVMYLKIEPGSQAVVNWKFSDGGDELKGAFQVLLNNSENFQKAIDKKLPVEVLN